MAYKDSPDNEFDQEMERILQEHFNAEDPNLRAPNDPWEWLESRLEEPPAPSFVSRLLGFMNPIREGRLSPAFAVAGVAVVAIVAAAVVLAISGNDGTEPPGGIAAVPGTRIPGNVPPSTVDLAATSRARPMEVTRVVERESAVREQAPAATTAPAAAVAQRAPASAPQSTEAPGYDDGGGIGFWTPANGNDGPGCHGCSRSCILSHFRSTGRPDATGPGRADGSRRGPRPGGSGRGTGRRRCRGPAGRNRHWRHSTRHHFPGLSTPALGGYIGGQRLDLQPGY